MYQKKTLCVSRWNQIYSSYCSRIDLTLIAFQLWYDQRWSLWPTTYLCKLGRLSRYVELMGIINLLLKKIIKNFNTINFDMLMNLVKNETLLLAEKNTAFALFYYYNHQYTDSTSCVFTDCNSIFFSRLSTEYWSNYQQLVV